MKIWATVFGAERTPSIGVYGTSKAEVQRRLSDRKANGEAFEGECVVWFASPATYNAALRKAGLPEIPETCGVHRGLPRKQF